MRLGGLAFACMLVACEDGGEASEPLSCEAGEWPVSGTVVREIGEHSWNEAFVAGPDAHMVVGLWAYYSDGPGTALGEMDVPVSDVPVDFGVCADAVVAEEHGGEFVVQVAIYNHAGTQGRVGDLINEVTHPFEGPTQDMVVEVFGLEHCDDPNAGGFCTTLE